jgi:hypothetical protein
MKILIALLAAFTCQLQNGNAQQHYYTHPMKLVWNSITTGNASGWRVHVLPISASTNPREYALQTCLKRRWIYVIGDSTARFFMHALLLLLHHQFPGSDFTRYLMFDGRQAPGAVSDHISFTTPKGCRQEDIKNNCGCLREYFDRQHGIRVTFAWITHAVDSELEAEEMFLEALVGQAVHPDLIVTSVGSWDILRGVGSKEGGKRAATWTRALAERYPTTYVAALSTNACPSIHDAAAAWFAHFREDVEQNRPSNLAFFDREPHTRLMHDSGVCDGYHVLPDGLNIQHVLTVIMGICQPV